MNWAYLLASDQSDATDLDSIIDVSSYASLSQLLGSRLVVNQKYQKSNLCERSHKVDIEVCIKIIHIL